MKNIFKTYQLTSHADYADNVKEHYDNQEEHDEQKRFDE